jgi:sensor histidine kinase regulating citrate/malate metabolism
MSERRVWGRLRLSTQIVLLQLAIICVTLGAGVTVSILQARAQLDRESGRQSLAIARSVSQIPAVRAAFGRPNPQAHGRGIRRRRQHRGDPLLASRSGQDPPAGLDRSE